MAHYPSRNPLYKPHLLRPHLSRKELNISKLQAMGKKALPGLIFMLLSFISVVSLLGAPGLTPNFTLMALFHWGIYRSLSPFLLIAVGLIQDAILGNYLGIHTFALIIVYTLVLTQRRSIFRQNFWVIWAGFSAVSFFNAALYQFIFWGLYQVSADFKTAFIQVLLTIFCYPLVVRFFVVIHRIMDS